MISFVVASYNGAAYIDDQLISILEGLGPNDEIVVSDDGSTDETIARVNALKDPRIKIIADGARLGYQKNFERAVRSAIGRYIFFSDQDDICLKARIPRSLEALETSDLVCGDAVVVNKDLATADESYFASRKARFGVAMLFLRPAVIGATMACRRDFLLRNLPFPEKVPHDMWLSIQAARRRRLAVVDEPFILYRRHAEVASATGTTRRRPLVQRVIERVRLVRALVNHRERIGTVA